MASEKLRAIIKTMRQNTSMAAADLSIAERRNNMEAGMRNIITPGDVETENLEVGGISCRWVRTPGAREDNCVV
ncbi:MAG: hypothetical protein OEZ23_10230, partial [Gammaproteobacteria bacterium]|nr:hypothetical protein [Gammaproteobacteria bacterium]